MSVPQWLLDTFAQAAERLGWQYKGLDDESMAVLVDDKGHEAKYGLQNIERRLAPLPDDQRVDKLLHHLRQLTSVHPVSDLAAARERLLVRLRPAFDEGDELGQHVWHQPLGETGLVQVLVIDYPDAMNYVTNDMLTDSGRTGEQWLTFALENLEAISERDNWLPLQDAPGLYLCNHGDAYDAARALLLDQVYHEPAPRGYLVGVPSRDRLLVYAVDDRALDRRFPDLLIATLGMHQNEPYPISDGLFWVYEGQWEAIGYDYQDGQLSIALPADLADLLGEKPT
jgi:uncharacterized protein YtpQ (UPF0354 family)